MQQQEQNRPPSAGLRSRTEEYELLKEAAQGGSYQARVRLGAAKRALDRQKAEQARRLTQDVGRRLATRGGG